MTQLLLWNQDSYIICNKVGQNPQNHVGKKRCAFLKYSLVNLKSYLIHEVLIGWIILNGSCQYMEDCSQKIQNMSSIRYEKKRRKTIQSCHFMQCKIQCSNKDNISQRENDTIALVGIENILEGIRYNEKVILI